MTTLLKKFTRWSNRKGVERLLGFSLPLEIAQIHYFKWKPSSDMAGYDAYVRLYGPLSTFLEITTRLNLAIYDQTRPGPHLPTDWRQSPEFERLDWWNPTAETPIDSASGSFGKYGWIIAKYENGHVYIVMSDTGHAVEP